MRAMFVLLPINMSNVFVNCAFVHRQQRIAVIEAP